MLVICIGVLWPVIPLGLSGGLRAVDILRLSLVHRGFLD